MQGPRSIEWRRNAGEALSGLTTARIAKTLTALGRGARATCQGHEFRPPMTITARIVRGIESLKRECELTGSVDFGTLQQSIRFPPRFPTPQSPIRPPPIGSTHRRVRSVIGCQIVRRLRELTRSQGIPPSMDFELDRLGRDSGIEGRQSPPARPGGRTRQGGSGSAGTVMKPIRKLSCCCVSGLGS